MNRLCYLAASVLLLMPAQLLAQNQQIPPESKDLLDDLGDWEIRERAQLEEKISDKRQEVIEKLKRHLEHYTKRGELDLATALQARIKALEAQELRPPSGMIFNLPWQAEGKTGPVWVTFHDDGTATWDNRIVNVVFDRGFRWEVDGPGVVELWYKTSEKGKGLRWTFADSYDSARVRDRKGGPEKPREAVRMR